MIFSKYFLKTPPKNALPFQTSEGVKKFFWKKGVHFISPGGNKWKNKFFWSFSRRAQILGVHFDPLCPNEWEEVLSLVSKTPDNFSFPSPNKWRGIVTLHLFTTEWPSDWDMTLRWYEQGNAAEMGAGIQKRQSGKAAVTYPRLTAWVENYGRWWKCHEWVKSGNRNGRCFWMRETVSPITSFAGSVRTTASRAFGCW